MHKKSCERTGLLKRETQNCESINKFLLIIIEWLKQQYHNIIEENKLSNCLTKLETQLPT